MPNPNARSSRAARMSAKSRRADVIAGRPPTLTLPRKGGGKLALTLLHEGGGSLLRLALAPGVERVVHRRFQLNLFLIALPEHQREASGNGAQPCGLGGDLHVVGHVGTMDDTGQLRERRVAQLVFADD